jgi:hypothetical protein
MNHDLVRTILIGSILFAASACHQASATYDPTETIRVTETQASAILPTHTEALQMTSSLPTPADPRLQNLIQKAISDLAQRQSISIDEITLLDATPVVWPDSSLGCPQEGMLYSQVVTSGYLIVLEHARSKFEYHAGRDVSSLTYCGNPTPPIPGTPSNT